MPRIVTWNICAPVMMVSMVTDYNFVNNELLHPQMRDMTSSQNAENVLTLLSQFSTDMCVPPVDLNMLQAGRTEILELKLFPEAITFRSLYIIVSSSVQHMSTSSQILLYIIITLK